MGDALHWKDNSAGFLHVEKTADYLSLLHLYAAVLSFIPSYTVVTYRVHR